MDVEDYADLRGIEIENPVKRKGKMKIMAKSNAQLVRELREANQRISELEQEKQDVLDALGVEIVDDESDDESDDEAE